MKAIQVAKPATLDTFRLVELDQSEPAFGEIAVRIHASSLNFHDYAVVAGMIPVDDGRIPMSDGAGEVIAVGEGVTEFAVGDRVMSTFFPNWSGGPVTAQRTLGVPGDHIDGFAAEYVCMPTAAFTSMPKDYSFEEAATLPCAALTAWRALFVVNDIRPGATVLTQGSGGVSVFALQMAKAAGATVIATSSSEEKLAKLGELGADHLINYKETPQWGAKVVELTGGRGVDEVVEIGGPGTLPQSIAATAVGGNISLIGVLTGWGGEVPTAEAMWKNISISGLTVGSHDHQRAMIRALEAADFRPVIDSSFPLEDISAAFRHQESQQHFGKICLTM
ncbi:MAG: NAD(P)-dependent alcohol dehydrogenase [Pseudomonadota bacterium]